MMFKSTHTSVLLEGEISMNCQKEHVSENWSTGLDNDGQKIIYTGEYEVCEACEPTFSDEGAMHSRCRASNNFCFEGKDCEDFIENCGCLLEDCVESRIL